ncbi:MAG: hypothetical protein HKN21_03975 [Candidatus Eisenbacteria bacterium]|uniref:Carboxypeptidase regulatory-like domain-containing protein n=1 Tax=Eiseniibacteriota bacterium TaxID=2212470 RepID=A0A7Y2E619_UNCEI|nr:hypothetical protein [Candidatus Eisenbacteria bacterium]
MRSSFRPMTLLAALLLTALAPTYAWAGIEPAKKFPRNQEPVNVTVTTTEDAPAAGVDLYATYRPGSNVASEQLVGKTDPQGRISWMPVEAGLVTLRAEMPDGSTQTQNLSVIYSEVPIMGLLVMVIAGIILYGGVIRGFSALNKLPADLPPDT